MSNLTTTRPARAPRTPKPLPVQIAERKARAEAQYDRYTIRKSAIKVTLADGTTQTPTVYYLHETAPKDGKNTAIRTLTPHGCDCEDACEARRLELNRPCKHFFMAAIFATRTRQADAPAPAAPAPVPATRPDRNEINRRISADFGDF